MVVWRGWCGVWGLSKRCSDYGVASILDGVVGWDVSEVAWTRSVTRTASFARTRLVTRARSDARMRSEFGWARWHRLSVGFTSAHNGSRPAAPRLHTTPGSH